VSEVMITCNNNGPLRIEGEFVIRDAQGKPFDLGGRRLVALCRCGASANKPFCDGAHRAIGFQSQIEAQPLPATHFGV